MLCFGGAGVGGSILQCRTVTVTIRCTVTVLHAVRCTATCDVHCTAWYAITRHTLTVLTVQWPYHAPYIGPYHALHSGHAITVQFLGPYRALYSDVFMQCMGPCTVVVSCIVWCPAQWPHSKAPYQAMHCTVITLCTVQWPVPNSATVPSTTHRTATVPYTAVWSYIATLKATHGNPKVQQ